MIFTYGNRKNLQEFFPRDRTKIYTKIKTIGGETMPDAWKSLRTSVSGTAIGSTFTNSLLTASSPAPTYCPESDKSYGGGTLYFCDSPETINGSTLLADGTTLASSVGYNVIVFTDTNGMTQNIPYRMFMDNANATGGNYTINFNVINLGASNANIKFGPIWGGTAMETTAAGTDAGKQWCDANSATDAQVPNDTISDIDVTPPVSTTVTTIPPFDGTLSTVVTLGSLSSINNKTNMCYIEMLAQDPDIHFYVVLNAPAAAAYQDDSATCQRYVHSRGTFSDRVCSRIHNPYVINTTTETPFVFRDLTISGEESVPDVNWTGTDYCLWAGGSSDSNVGYGRLFYNRVSVQNTSSSTKNFAIVATPRTPSSNFFGYVRDVGANLSVRVPATGSVATGVTTSGTVVWKGTVSAGATVHKRIRYSPTGSSSGKLSFWVIEY